MWEKIRKRVTLELIGSALIAIAAAAAYLADVLPATYAAYATVAAAVCYAVVRGVEKYRADLKRGWRTTEAWFAAANVILLALYAIPGDLSAKAAAGLAVIIGIALQVARVLAKPKASPVQIE
jgi:hypothetical protein